MTKYTLFLNNQARDPQDAGGCLIPLVATTIEEARVEALACEHFHDPDNSDVATVTAEILEIVFRERIDK